MPPPSKPRVLLYGRVSLDRHEGKSVDQQLVEGRKVAEREGWCIVGEHRDDGVSASRYARGKARPGWQAAMEEITRGCIDLLVVWEISRATRDRAPWAALLAACTDTGTRIAVGGRVHDPADPDDGFMLDLSAALAVRESGVSSKRIRRDVAARAAQGRPHGRLGYGWTRLYDVRPDGTRVLLKQVPDPNTAPYIAEAAERFVAGDSFYAIAKDFDRRGVPRLVDVRNARLERPPAEPGAWDPKQVHRMVSSPANAGIRALRGDEVVEQAWEAIIPMATYRRVQAILADPTRLSHRGNEPRWLLSGIARCAVCGGNVRRMKNRGYDTYICATNFCIARRTTRLDEYVREIIVARADAGTFLTGGPGEGERRAAPKGINEHLLARAEVEGLRGQLQGWVEASVAGEVSPASFAQIERGLLAKIEDAQRRAAPPKEVKRSVKEFLTVDDPGRAWDERLTIEGRREIVAELLDIKIRKARRGTRTLDPDTIDVQWRV